MQSQLICNGCRNILRYPRMAASVFCVLCNTLNSVPSPGNLVAHVVCGVCRALLVYNQGATRIRCFQCYTISSTRTANQVAHLTCGQCRSTLIYPYGAPSVKCALCHYITNVRLSSISTRVPLHGPNGTSPVPLRSYAQQPYSHSKIVIIENPMSVDNSGKLVSNVVVGVATAGRK